MPSTVSVFALDRKTNYRWKASFPCFYTVFYEVCFWQVILVEGWHDLDNKDYDCWPLEKPDEYNMMDCGGEF